MIRAWGAVALTGAAVTVTGGFAQAAPPVPAAAVPAASAGDPRTYTPGVIDWHRDGSGASFGPKTGATRETRKALLAWQPLLGVKATGVWNRETEEAVGRFQRAKGIRVTKRIGYQTAKALVMPIIVKAAGANGIPPGLLCGHLFLESRLYTGAVGPNGKDLGLGQHVYRYYPNVNPWSVHESIWSMARVDAANIARYGLQIGPVAYWSPEEAARSKRNGKLTAAAAGYRHQVHLGC